MSDEAKDGKPLEKVVRLIHETLKDRPNTLIYSNHKIENTGGRKREFDVFIETSINDIQIKIAVECKEYSKPISVEKIEAFKAKCDRVPTINKKIFVSKSGYQTDSINAAREFGIDLYDIKDIEKEVILKWFPISQLGLRFGIKNYNFIIDITENELERIKSEQFIEFYFREPIEKVEVIKFINDRVFENKKGLWGINLIEFLKNGGGKSVGQSILIPFQVKLKDAYILSKAGEQYPLMGIQGELESFFIERPLEISKSQVYGSNNEIKAGRLSIKPNNTNEQTDIILTKDKFKIFHTDNKGTTKEFGLITTFDPKTGKFSNEK
jgi:hypothetical protein